MPYTVEQIGARAKERNPELSKFSDKDIGERLVKRNPGLATLVASKEKEPQKAPATQKPFLRKVGDFFTGNTQKFAETLGAAAAQVSGVADDINASKIREAEAIQQLSRIKPKTPQQEQNIKSQLSQAPSVPLATEAIPALKKSAKQVYGEALGTGLEAVSGGLLGTGKAGVLGKAVPKVAAKTLGTAVLRGAGTGAVYGGLSGASQGLQTDAKALDIGKSALLGAGAGASIGGALGAIGYGIGKLPQKLDKKSEDIYRKVLKMSPSEMAKEAKQGKNTPALLKKLKLTGNVQDMTDDLEAIYEKKENALTNLLKKRAKAGVAIDVDDLEKAANESLEQYRAHVAEYDSIQAKVSKIIENTRKNFGNTIGVDNANEVKRALWKDAFSRSNSEIVNDAVYEAGSAMKKLIEQAIPDKNIAGMNNELGQFVVASKQLLKSAVRPQSGKMSSRLGAIIGTIIGLPGGPWSALGTGVAGSQVDKYITSNPALQTKLAQLMARYASSPPLMQNIIKNQIVQILVTHGLIKVGQEAAK